MNAADDPRNAAQRLREEVRDFCATAVPSDLLRKAQRHDVLDRSDYERWMRLLQTRSWAVGHWPREHGGLGWSPFERFAFEDELARHGCPWVIPFGVKYVGPVICTYGTDAQKQRFLPGILETRDWWAQGFSEPGAGSDLAALRTQATRDGDGYVITGQKTWTTYAQWADWLFCLARTSREARPQQGISFFLIDMKSPGVSVREIATMDGYRHVNEVWLDAVRVPASHRVGEEGAGWNLAKFLLKNERTAGAIVGQAWHALQRLKRAGGGARIAEFELRLLALEAVAYQCVEAMTRGEENGGEASHIKIRGAGLLQDLDEAIVAALGIEALVPAGGGTVADAPGLLREHLYQRAGTIFGGSSEIQRNIIARQVLGL